MHRNNQSPAESIATGGFAFFRHHLSAETVRWTVNLPTKRTQEQGRDPRSRPPPAHSYSAPQSHLLGPSLTWQERGGAYPAARRTRGRRARSPPMWRRPRSPGGTWVSRSWGCTDRRMARTAPDPGHPLPWLPPRRAGARVAHAAGPPSSSSSVARSSPAAPHLPGRGV